MRKLLLLARATWDCKGIALTVTLTMQCRIKISNIKSLEYKLDLILIPNTLSDVQE
jgi:hypothetical protein